MLKIILRRLLLSVPLVFLVSIITFALQSFVPGDPAYTLLGLNATEEEYAALRAALHLNEPIATQYWIYLQGVLQGDFGRSIFTNQPVTAAIGQRLPVTLSLLVGAILVASIIGVLLGTYSATRGRIARGLLDGVSLLGNALPNFWVGLVLSSVFALSLGLFPSSGYTAFADSPSKWLASIVLPVTALAFGGVAIIAKATRDGVMNTLQQDYIRTLRASGVHRRSTVWKHALRNSGVATVTAVGLSLIGFIPGSILVENVFALPGLGGLIVEATNKHDVPVIQGVALTFTLIVVATNLIVDVLYGIINPKVRVQ